MRRALLGSALAAVMIASTACGSSSSSGVDPDSVANAATKTSTLKSFRVHTTTTFKLGSRDLTFKGDGVFASKARRGRLSLDMSALNQIVGAQGSPYNLGYALFIVDGDALYMRIPILKQLNPNLRPWVKLDLGQAGRTQQLDFGSFLQFSQGGDPTQALEYLRAAGKVNKEGKADVHGVATTRYKVAVDLRKVAGKAAADRRDELRKNINRLIALTGSSTIPIDVWIDKQGYVRKELYTEKVELRGQKAAVEASVELFGFGSPVVAPVPPAADVTDLTGAVPGANS
ncbi:MAG TPA: hypothetical protein VE688_12315 [Gaiellaceae bacterium]|nr:hypothetical protein [Gaiellaceae bacterium]